MLSFPRLIKHAQRKNPEVYSSDTVNPGGRGILIWCSPVPVYIIVSYFNDDVKVFKTDRVSF
uniref:Uncharacterized protein n=1 Tax=Anguilla anguilla TaxID=7936 RepID=A0A0E9WU67_ANGAN